MQRSAKICVDLLRNDQRITKAMQQLDLDVSGILHSSRTCEAARNLIEISDLPAEAVSVESDVVGCVHGGSVCLRIFSESLSIPS